MQDSTDIESLQETSDTPERSRPAGAPGKTKESAVDPVVQAAETTSRRTLIGLIISSVLATVSAITVAEINKCGGTGSHSQNFDTPKADSAAELSGGVFDNNDNPIQGAKAMLDGVPGVRSVETDSDGNFTLKDVPIKRGDKVRLRVVKEGYRPRIEDVVLGGTPPRIKLEREK